MKTSDFDYHLPPELIAQTPIEPRDQSRLMVLSRADGSIEHRHFFEIVELLHQGDVLVFNDSRVIPARLIGHKEGSEGKVELLLLRRLSPGLWETLARPGRRVNVGTRIEIAADGLWGEVLERGDGAIRVVHFSDEAVLERVGRVPLPPYIHLPLEDPERYQTVYSRVKGSVAAPTAGLHFTPELLQHLEEKGVQFAFVTLHVGLDTFSPVRVADPMDHPMHKEYGELRDSVSQQLNEAKAEGRRIICVGTTTVRVLEQGAIKGRGIEAFQGWTDLLILPGHHFHTLDGLITNFHLPRSTLLMLVAAFAGQGFIKQAYEEAIHLGYRFYSFGDAMLVL
ncbi:MAG: tRNA preQ1(34) S-adenosylmethionine ribosyltransferase-isomerase QueA [Dehalococcoidia bacterium]|nr:tRNA preQ1(34) S-adenosylmethionine ribosyltransferase-isomerase QueA [Dehalococcoidia bacterium]